MGAKTDGLHNSPAIKFTILLIACNNLTTGDLIQCLYPIITNKGVKFRG